MVGLKPMFPYYGSKATLAPRYPAPRFDTVVEPFAGSACYSLLHYDRRVILLDSDPVVAGLWEFLIRVSPDEVKRIPIIPRGGSVDILPVQEWRWLVGFWASPGSSGPRRTIGKRWRVWDERARLRVARQVPLIRHWVVRCADYHDAPDVAATWFIDPPYQRAGVYYVKSGLDYSDVGRYCVQRRGQVIVCENVGARWLPFQPFAVSRSKMGTSKEAIWTSGC